MKNIFLKYYFNFIHFPPKRAVRETRENGSVEGIEIFRKAFADQTEKSKMIPFAHLSDNAIVSVSPICHKTISNLADL